MAKSIGFERTVPYLLAVLAVGVAVVAHVAADPGLGNRVTLSTFLVTVALSAWFAGLQPAVLVLLLGSVMSGWLFVLPRPIGASVQPNPGDEVAVLFYLLVGGLVIVLIETLRRAERRANQEAATARASEARFRTFMVASSQLVWTTDAGGIVVEDSPSWRAFTGQTVEEIREWGWLNALHPDDRERVAAAWSAAVRDGTLLEIEYRLRRADGIYRWTLARAAPVHNDDGSVREWVGRTRTSPSAAGPRRRAGAWSPSSSRAKTRSSARRSTAT